MQSSHKLLSRAHLNKLKMFPFCLIFEFLPQYRLPITLLRECRNCNQKWIKAEFLIVSTLWQCVKTYFHPALVCLFFTAVHTAWNFQVLQSRIRRREDSYSASKGEALQMPLVPQEALYWTWIGHSLHAGYLRIMRTRHIYCFVRPTFL